MPRFTTITDLTARLFDLDPGLRDELTDDQMREIAQAHRVNRYEDITPQEIDAMIRAAYAACGVDPDQIEA